MHSSRDNRVNLADRACEFNFLGMFETHIFNRPTSAHRHVFKLFIAIGHGRRQTLSGQQNSRPVEIIGRHQHFARAWIQCYINIRVFKRVNNARLLIFGQ